MRTDTQGMAERDKDRAMTFLSAESRRARKYAAQLRRRAALDQRDARLYN